MAERKVTVSVDEPFDESIAEEWITQWVVAALNAEGIDKKAEVSVLITGDELVQQLNKEFLGEDEPTDVLSFGTGELDEPGLDGTPAFISPPDGMVHLGEIIISYPFALRQAEKEEHPVDWEIAHLLVHGVLHLLGYDHLEPVDEQEMRAREHGILGMHY